MSILSQLKRLVVGKPLPTSNYIHERLTNPAGLAILASDALSSVAYATEEILLVLIVVGSGALSLSLPIAAAIVLLLAIVTLSYAQTIRAYPNGGGAYTVAKENLGLYPGLVAAASLLIDYILTVTVSVSAGIAALTSAVPVLRSHTVPLCLLAIGLIMLANLRGLREAGRLFMMPTYAFIVSILCLIGIGFFRLSQGIAPSSAAEIIPATGSLSLFLILRAFSAGCTALTGVEAIANGVQVFKPPEWRNARQTLTYMGMILGTLFLGITYLANAYHIVPTEDQTVVSLLGREILGSSPFYYGLQVATLLILLLAANTSYSDFPRLASLVAQDGFLPRQLTLLGDRLVFTNGIQVLSLGAALLIVLFQGQVNALIPLYAVGVFTSFTLSQTGMIRHWWQERLTGWQISAVINGLGAMTTGVVLVVIITTKFLLGAWIVAIAIPLVVALFLAVHRHYQWVSRQLSLPQPFPLECPLRQPTGNTHHPAVIMIGQIHRGMLDAVYYACSIADEIVAVHVDIGSTDRTVLQERWEKLGTNVPLVILESPYRSVIGPLVDYITEFEAKHSDTFTTIILPVFVTRHWWEALLHNQTALFLRQALRTKRSRIVTLVRYYL